VEFDDFLGFMWIFEDFRIWELGAEEFCGFLEI
jgi:hypothetical protein